MTPRTVLALTLFTLPAAGLVALTGVSVLGAALLPLGNTSHAGSFASVPQAPPAAAAIQYDPAQLATSTTAVDEVLVLRTRPDRTKIEQGGAGRVRVRVDLNGIANAASSAVPTDMIVVLDVSGSMSGEKLDDAKSAVNALIGRLGPEDRFALVPFSSRAEQAVPLTYASAESGARFTHVVDNLRAGGGTDMMDGLSMGLRVASDELTDPRARRMFLISDGLPNSEGGLADLARASAAMGAPLTTVGIGLDYNEVLLSSLADHGTGNFFWATPNHDLTSVFDAEFGAAKAVVASRLQLSFSAESGTRLIDAAGLPIRLGDDGEQLVDLGSLHAGQERSVWLTLSVPTGVATDVDLGALALHLTRNDGSVGAVQQPLGGVTVVQDQAEALAALDVDAWEQAVVQEDWGKLQSDVSRLAQRGEHQAAKQRIAEYRDAVEATNRVVRSAVVSDNLHQAAELDQQLDDTFSGTRQEYRRNVWSKTLNSGSLVNRRGGSYSGY